MNKLIAILFIIAAFCVACRAQELVFSNQTITVQPQQLSVESVEYRAESVETNTVYSWVDSEVVYTNDTAGFTETTYETNTVQQQVSEEVVTTNAAVWICNVIFELPRGHTWALNDFPVTIDRFKTRLQVPVDPEVVTGAFGPAAAGLEFAAQNGAYTPTGQVRDAFLSFAAAELAGGAADE